MNWLRSGPVIIGLSRYRMDSKGLLQRTAMGHMGKADRDQGKRLEKPIG